MVDIEILIYPKETKEKSINATKQLETNWKCRNCIVNPINRNERNK